MYVRRPCRARDNTLSGKERAAIGARTPLTGGFGNSGFPQELPRLCLGNHHSPSPLFGCRFDREAPAIGREVQPGNRGTANMRLRVGAVKPARARVIAARTWTTRRQVEEATLRAETKPRRRQRHGEVRGQGPVPGIQDCACAPARSPPDTNLRGRSTAPTCSNVEVLPDAEAEHPRGGAGPARSRPLPRRQARPGPAAPCGGHPRYCGRAAAAGGRQTRCGPGCAATAPATRPARD